MDNVIPVLRPDVVSIPTAPRPTPTPVRLQFSEVLAGSARALVRGAQAAVRSLPGAPLMAVAVRGGASVAAATSGSLSLGGSPAFSAQLSASPEGPGGSALASVGIAGGVAAGTGPSGIPSGGALGSTVDGGLEGSMAQAQQMNLYYLQVQEEVNAQNRTFTALSNVLEVEHNTAKSAIGNIH
jgi:hypothetical protein